MTKKQSTTLIIVALVVLGGLVWIASTQSGQSPADTADQGDQETPAETATATADQTPGEEVAPGGNQVTDDGEVVNEEGEEVDTAAEPDSENAPQQSDPVSEGQIPEESIQLDVSSSGYSPSQFTVQSGAPVTIAVTATDDQTHIFKFHEEEMQGVAVGVGPGVTRTVSFNAPDPGEYTYFCDVPGHEARGESGTMIVE